MTVADREPALVDDRSRGVKGVSRVATGVYCLDAGELSPGRTTTVVSVDGDASDPALDTLAVVEVRGTARECDGKTFEVVTRELSDGRPAASDRVGFTLLIA